VIGAYPCRGDGWPRWRVCRKVHARRHSRLLRLSGVTSAIPRRPRVPVTSNGMSFIDPAPVFGVPNVFLFVSYQIRRWRRAKRSRSF
jgi:hypothetical protein